MELWQLRTFKAVAKNLHFTRAAEELNLSQPAVSHQIKSLEENIGEKLFLRDKEGIELTKIGEKIYEHATKILDIAEELEIEIKEEDDFLTGSLKIGGVTRGLNNPFFIFYNDFKKKYPDIELYYHNEYVFEGIAESVRKGEIDIGFVSNDVDVRGLKKLPYGFFDFILVVANDHHLVNKKKVSIVDLQNQDWVMFETSHRLTILTKKFFKEINILPKSIYETNDGSLIRTIVSSGKKIALLPEWGVFEDIANDRMKAVEVEGLRLSFQLNLIWKPESDSKKINALMAFLLEKEMQGIKFINPTNK